MAGRRKLVPSRPLVYPIHEVTMSSQRILGQFEMAGTKCRSQVTGHRKCNKKVRHCWACHVYLFVSFPVTSRSGICLASTMLPVVLRVKELNGESYTLYHRLHLPVNTPAQNMFSHDAKRLGFTAGTKRRPQVTGPGLFICFTGHRKCNKKVRHCWAFYVYLFVSFPVTSQSGICLALTMLPVVLRVKKLSGPFRFVAAYIDVFIVNIKLSDSIL